MSNASLAWGCLTRIFSGEDGSKIPQGAPLQEILNDGDSENLHVGLLKFYRDKTMLLICTSSILKLGTNSFDYRII